MSDASDGYSAAERLRTGSRDDVRDALVAQRARTLALADHYVEALGPELAVPQDPGLNPPRWELGHVAWFQEWWIARNRQRALGHRCDPSHDRPPPSLAGADAWFDSTRVAHGTRWSLPLPPVGALRHWMADGLQATLAQLEALPADAGDDALYFFRLACLHEAMHAEAACYMARMLDFSVPLPARAVGALRPLPVAAQPFRLGWSGPGFAFDNELAAHEVVLAAYEIDSVPVTWDRFAGFVDAGGYQEPRWWTAAGWQWRQRERHQPPRLPRGHGPAVHLSCHEAEAWCRWAGRRLPTEAEWECAALTVPGFAWGHVWEWRASTFGGWPGFTPHPYREYSQPWFGGMRVLRGACAATSAVLAHPRYRNFFDPGRTDVFSGFRTCAVAPAALGV